MSNPSTSGTRQVFLPLERLDECVVCKKKISLRLCASCEEIVYCSRDCQRSHRPEHKLICGKTDKIELGGYYPFLAVLFELGVVRKPANISITRKIVNTFDRDTPPTRLPDGTAAVLVCLGEELPEYNRKNMKEWWPTTPSDKWRLQMNLRMFREGWHLPIYLAIAISLLAEIYTTNSFPHSESLSNFERTRTRLRIWGSPVSDFGIAKGSLQVESRSLLAYLDTTDGSIIKGQDPDSHYMIYFHTLRGDEYVLDCSGHAFGHSVAVWHLPYAATVPDYPGWCLPALFRAVTVATFIADTLTIQERYSVLRDTRLQRAVRSRSDFSKKDQYAMIGFLNELAGRRCNKVERDIFMTTVRESCIILRQNLHQRNWADWPEKPASSLDGSRDTGDTEMTPFINQVKHLEKHIRRVRRGEITLEEASNACGKQLVKR